MPITPEDIIGDDTIDAVADKAESLRNDATDTINDVEKQVVDFIKQKPVVATLAALLIGLVVGRLVL